MVDIKTLFYIIGGLLTIGGAVVTFFNMQVRQNMKIEQLEKDINMLKEKASSQSRYQISTEKDIVKMNEKLDNLIDMMKELKDRGCGNCGKG